MHAGSCLCGAVRFEVTGSFARFYLCHCEYCQKDSGSAHSANLFAAAATLKWLRGSEQVVTFNLPGTRHSKSFCGTCGSALPREEGTTVVVPAGSLDAGFAQRPDAHLFIASRARWDDELEKVPMLQGLPSS